MDVMDGDHGSVGRTRENPTRDGDGDVDWEQAFRSYVAVVSGGGPDASKLRATVRVALLCPHAPIYILASTVRILVPLLDDRNPRLRQVAACALRRIARRDGGVLRGRIGHDRALPALARMLRGGGGDVAVRRVVVGCIRDVIAFENSSRIALARSGGLKAVVDALQTTATGRLRRDLLEVVSMLATLKEVRRALVGTRDMSCLVEAVAFGRMRTRARAAHAVGFLATAKRSRQMLVDAGVLPVLVDLLRDGDANAKLAAANSLGIFPSNVDFLRMVVDAGAIPLYAELLQGSDPMGRDIAEDVFSLLAVVEEPAVSILGHLVRILREGDDDGKGAAADVVWDMAINEYSSPVVSNSGATKLLIDILRDGHGFLRERVSGAITQLSYEELDRRVLAEEGVIPILISLVNADSDDLKENAAEALDNFSNDPLFQERVREALDDSLVRDRGSSSADGSSSSTDATLL